MGYPQELDGLFQGKSHLFLWMMTGGTPMTWQILHLASQTAWCSGRGPEYMTSRPRPTSMEWATLVSDNRPLQIRNQTGPENGGSTGWAS